MRTLQDSNLDRGRNAPAGAALVARSSLRYVFALAAVLASAGLSLPLVAQPAEPAAAAAPAGRGTIQGRVFNAGTGKYLNNARVAVEGTSIQTFTNEYGEFRLYNVPAGEVRLRVFYTGLTPQTVPLTLPAGETLAQDVSIGAAEDTVTLDTFTVAAGRETNIAAIATNEQRFAPNIKTVIETDAFGDVAEGNVGEFLKFLPGVTVDYVAADVRTVSVRGFGPAFSSVYLDGFRGASAASGSSIRSFEFEQVSINNASRIEVAKVPTPSLPADALGGSVNMIGKNAFERKGVQLNYRAYVNMNSEDMSPFDKSPGPSNEDSYKVLPGADFDLTLPVTENLGFVVTGLTSNQFNEQHRSQPAWNFNQAGATPTNPYLQSYQMQDGPKNSYRDSASVRMDWRISPSSTLWAGYQFNYYHSFFGNRNITWDVSTNATPTPSSGSPLTWGSDFTEGATGRGSVRHGGSFRDKYGASNTFLTKYRFNGQHWEADVGVGYSKSKSWYRDTGDGHFSEIRTTLQGVSSGGRILFDDYDGVRPLSIRATDSSGGDIDYTNLSNYRLNTVRSVPLDAKDEFRTLHANAKRDLDFLPFPASIKFGGEIREQTRDIRRLDTTWNFVGADGSTNTADDNAAAYLDTKYGPYSYWGFDNIQWYDPYKLYDTFLSSPAYFTQTNVQMRNAERYRLRNSQNITETVTAAYVEGEVKLLNNRLTLLGGVRFERTEDEGDGVYAPTSGLGPAGLSTEDRAAAGLADIRANWVERGNHVEKTYDGYYPSLHATFNITDDLLLRAAYAKALGRPDFGNILPLVRVNDTDETDDGLAARTVEVTNPDLEPYEADNIDLSLEYYFRNGGVISTGVFWKEIEGFFTTPPATVTAADVTELGIDDSYIGYSLRRKINGVNSAHVRGVEFNFRQPLTFIPGLGRNLTFFLNATKLDLDGSAEDDFTGFIEESANTGITFDKKPVTFRINVNYRGRQINSAQTGSAYGSTNGFAEYYKPRATVDVNADYQFSRRVTIFANVRNLFNHSQDLERYNDVTPDYAREYRKEKFGAQITVGVKGTW
ncbi:MAG TPA: TonB-dependent receptor [Opitutaceae bacterium]